MKKIFICTFIIYFQILLNGISNEIKILYKINDGIITNQDVLEEINYLVALNKNLSKLNNEQLSSNAQRSLIREIIKKDEIKKFYEIDYDEAIKSEEIILIIKNFRENLGFNSNLDELKKKFIIEKFWNQLIFEKYKNFVKIDTNKIDIELEELIKNNSEILTFNLSEIIFLEKNKDTVEKKAQEIINSIQTIGFKDSAVIHSISESAKLGGEIGWINQNQMPKKIFSTIKNLEIGEFSKPIITAGGIVILKINDKKKVSSNIDKKNEMKRLISFERDRILNEYSMIYYKEIENKAYIEKF